MTEQLSSSQSANGVALNAELAGHLAAMGATFDHVAFASPRIRDLLALWRDTMGGEFAIGADNPDIGWRTARLRFGGAMVVELIEPLGDSTFFAGFFAKNPRGGIHHVTFVVDDVANARDRFAAAGLDPFGFTEDFQVFVHPRNAGGVLLQVMKRHPDSDYENMTATLEDVLAGRGINGTGIVSP